MSDNLGLQIGFSTSGDTNVLAVFDKISNSNKKLVADNKKSEDSIKQLTDKFEKLGETAKRAFEAFLVIEIVKNINEVAESIANATDRAQALGVSAESLAQFGFAAKLAGVDVGTVEDSLSKFAVRLGDLQSGNQEAIDSFKELGLSASSFAGKNLTQSYTLAAEATQKITDKNTQASAAQDVFGRSFSTALALARDGLSKNIALYDKLGVSLTESQREVTKQFVDSEDVLGTIYQGVKEKIVVNLAAPLAEMTEQLITFIQKSGGIDKVASNVSESILAIIQGTIDTFKVISNTLSFLIDKLNTLRNSSFINNTASAIADAASEAGGPRQDTFFSNLNAFGNDLFAGNVFNNPFANSFNPSAAFNDKNLYPDPFPFNPNGVNRSAQNLIASQSTGAFGSGNTPVFANDPDGFLKRTGANTASLAILPNIGKVFTDVTTSTNLLKGAFDKTKESTVGLGQAIAKSGDQITAAFKALESKNLTDAVNRIFAIVDKNQKGITITPEEYDKETQAGLDNIKNAGIIAQGYSFGKTGGAYNNQDELNNALSQYATNRQLNKPGELAPTTSPIFDKAAAELVKDLQNGLSGQAYEAALRNLTLQSNLDLQTGQGSLDQRVIEEIGKYAKSLGADKRQIDVGISVAPTKDFVVKVFTNADASPYIAGEVAGLAAQAAAIGAN